MRPIPIAVLTSIALPLAVALPAGTASAHDYCVAKPRCAGTVVAAAQLQTQLTAAETNGVADRFFLGSGVFAGGPYSYVSTEPVELHGTRGGSTVTTIQPAVAGRTVLTLSGPAVSIDGVRIEIGLDATTGIKLTGGTARNLSIQQLLGTSVGSGATLGDGATLADSTVLVRTGSVPAIGLSRGSATVTDTRVFGSYGVMTVPGAGTLTVARSTITAAFGAFAFDGTIKLSDTVVDGRGERLSAGFIALGQGGRPVIEAARTTVVGGDPASVNVVGAYAAANAGTATVTVRDSAMTGIGVPSLRMADPGAFASVTLDRVAHADPIGSADSGPGTSTETNRLPAPTGFVDPSDSNFRLLPGSSLIDAGDPVFTTAAGATDRNGDPRLRDGDGDCAARLDVGAYEFQRSGPHAAAAAGAASAAPNAAVAFSAAGSCAADLAEPLTYAWRFDDGAGATGAQVEHAFATPGAHSATVTVTDPGGGTAEASATVTIAVPPAGPGPQLPTGPAADRTAPRLSAVRVPRRLKPGAALPRLRAGRRASAIAFTLSERASVTLRFARRGRDGRYRAVRRGSLQVRAAAGANRLRFAGRLTRRARLARGRYRVTLTALDAAGNRSRAASARFRIG